MADSGNLLLNSLTITNSHPGVGNNGTLSVTNCTFIGNSNNYGGGIANNGALTVTASTFANNTATNNGGGISLPNAGGSLTVTGSTFTGNSAVGVSTPAAARCT